MRRIILVMIIMMSLMPCSVIRAQIPILAVIQAAVKKVLNAIDLEVQRLQNKTIWLQNAQKELENVLSETKLGEISDWVEKHRKLYSDYYQELWQVKELISGYEKVKNIIRLQSSIVSEYKKAYGLFKQDKHFTQAELNYMFSVYSGILDESLKNVDQVLLVVNAFVTQMSDGQRLSIINQVAKSMEKNYSDLKQFNKQSVMLSLQRGTDEDDINSIKHLYGLE